MSRTPLLAVIAVLSVALIVCAVQWRREASAARIAADRDRSIIADLHGQLSKASRYEEIAPLKDRIDDLSAQLAAQRSSASPSRLQHATAIAARSPKVGEDQLPAPPQTPAALPTPSPAGGTSCPPQHPPVEPAPLPGDFRASIASVRWTAAKGQQRLHVVLSVVNGSALRHRIPFPFLLLDINTSVRKDPLPAGVEGREEWIDPKQTLGLAYEFVTAKGNDYTLVFGRQSLPIKAE